MSYAIFKFFSYLFLLFINLILSYLFVLYVYGLQNQTFSRYLWQISIYLIGYLLHKLMTRRMVSSQEFISTQKANLFSLTVIVLLLFIGKTSSEYSRKVVFLFFILNLFIPISIYFIKRYFLQNKCLRKPVFAICDKDGYENIKRWFVKDNALGFDVVKLIRIDKTNGKSIIKSVNDTINAKRYYAVIIALSANNSNRIFYLIDRIQPHIEHIIIVPALSEIPIINIKIATSINNKGLAFFVQNNLLNPMHRFAKTVFDKIASVVLIAIFFPVLFITYVAVLIDTKGHPIFKHERIGQNGSSFKLYKFRTMSIDADSKLAQLLENDIKAHEEWKKNFKLKNDPRVTKIGAFLRKSSLDELPQLINVIKGDMSLVGPRPIVKEEVVKYGIYFDYFKAVKPGITGLWQVSGRNDINYDERVRIDVWYVRNWSLEIDIVILLKTVASVLTGKGSY